MNGMHAFWTGHRADQIFRFIDRGAPVRNLIGPPGCLTPTVVKPATTATHLPTLASLNGARVVTFDEQHWSLSLSASTVLISAVVITAVRRRRPVQWAVRDRQTDTAGWLFAKHRAPAA